MIIYQLEILGSDAGEVEAASDIDMDEEEQQETQRDPSSSLLKSESSSRHGGCFSRDLDPPRFCPNLLSLSLTVCVSLSLSLSTGLCVRVYSLFLYFDSGFINIARDRRRTIYYRNLSSFFLGEFTMYQSEVSLTVRSLVFSP